VALNLLVDAGERGNTWLDVLGLSRDWDKAKGMSHGVLKGFKGGLSVGRTDGD